MAEKTPADQSDKDNIPDEQLEDVSGGSLVPLPPLPPIPPMPG